jgi:hypothetical protein
VSVRRTGFLGRGGAQTGRPAGVFTIFRRIYFRSGFGPVSFFIKSIAFGGKSRGCFELPVKSDDFEK